MIEAPNTKKLTLPHTALIFL